MLDINSPSKTFLGIRFVLFGFDFSTEREVRAKLLNGGAVDAGLYGPNCTHVIVDKIVYDDPICVGARKDRKTVVTGLWVEHSHDIGMAVDATSIMYRPLRDLNGIPGAKSLIICLTGYQRQDRDDIMTMVGLMGAQFSKPLVANKVTHLICYKFEGEKYELANKLKKIKLVNHCWLEDCLREWELLPEDNYGKSGHELEMMEAEANDSEEEVEGATGKQSNFEMVSKSPQLKFGTPKPCQLPKSTGELPKIPHNSAEPEGQASSLNLKGILLTPGIKNTVDRASGFDSNHVFGESFHKGAGTFSDTTSVGLPDQQERTPNSTKWDSNLESVSRSYIRKTPRKSPSSIFSGELGNIRGSPKVLLAESINKSSAKIESSEDSIASGHAEYLQKGSELLYKEASSSKKQKIDVLSSNSKSQNTCHDVQPSMAGSPLVSCNQGLEPASLLDGLSGIDNHSSLGNPDQYNTVCLDVAQQLLPSASTGKSFQLEKPSMQGALLPENAVTETGQNESLNERSPQTSFKRLRKSSLADKLEVRDFGVEKSEHVVTDTGVIQHHLQDKQVPSPCDGTSGTVKGQTIANLEELQEENANLITKPGRKKMIAKKTLGSRPKLKSTANHKGSSYLNKAAARKDSSIGLAGERANHEMFSNANELETSPVTVNAAPIMDVDSNICAKSGDDIEIKTSFMDDETGTPEDKDVLDEEKVEGADLSHEADNRMEFKPEGVQLEQESTASGMKDVGKEGSNAVQLQQKYESKENVIKGKASKGRTQPSAKTKTKMVPPVSEQTESKKDLDGGETIDGKDNEKKVMKKEKGKPCSAGKTKSRTASGKKVESYMEVGKENKPFVDEDQNISQAKNNGGKTIVNSDEVSMMIKLKSKESNPNCTSVRKVSKQVKTEPVWFILSGHKLQRKEFQQLIRRLKGKCCRDTHQWSYQATHFISPDPVRRTEKFFAAAASGRWILKTDYLTACSQAGRFLDEEPYEWHKNGLSEDGAINLEAPRKWRILREKTGHGAFYGMRVIIYGDCIAPPLDTLKRVVKAGDGTILATSPPYTRFLTSGVDYAIISPGMPCVDMWVQEFLKHEIPCIVADYLVEYVCKPGYSLERHVLYNTHAWAEKSFANLLNRAEEIVGDSTSSDNSSNSDVACQVCGSPNRGDVMLICGNESGSVGCGVGMHIDCCDPPRENIPEEDWFCPNCITSNSNSKNSRKRMRKGSSSLKKAK